MRASGNRKRCPKHLFSDGLEGMLNKASNSHLVVVFLDYDGTLSPIPRRVAKLERPLSDTARISLYELSRQGKDLYR